MSNMKNRLLSFFVAIATVTAMTTTVSANNYNFSSGADSDETFGKSSSTDAPISKDESQLNIRRNKDVTDFPPSYGVFSGEFDTEVTNPYVQKQYEEESFSNWASGAGGTSTNFSSSANGDFLSWGQLLPSTSMLAETESTSFSVSYLSSTNTSRSVITDVSYLADGSIGTLKVPSLGKTVKVYEDTSVASMRAGLGHFSYTSAWDGLVGLAGHNRGDYAHFSFLKDLKKGDKLSYTTAYGTRNYSVSGIYKISADDTSFLNWSSENQLIMITCIANEPNYRLCVVAT